MDNFKDMMRAKKSAKISGEVVSGTFLCQTCGEFVYEAELHRSSNKLVWVCSQGHGSAMDWIL